MHDLALNLYGHLRPKRIVPNEIILVYTNPYNFKIPFPLIGKWNTLKNVIITITCIVFNYSSIRIISAVLEYNGFICHSLLNLS